VICFIFHHTPLEVNTFVSYFYTVEDVEDVDLPATLLYRYLQANLSLKWPTLSDSNSHTITYHPFSSPLYIYNTDRYNSYTRYSSNYCDNG